MQVSENIKARQRKWGTVTGLVAILALVALVFGAKNAAGQVKSALELCITSVIPSVFPMAVMSNIISLGSGGELIGRLMGGAVGKIFGVSRPATSSVVLGFICGFPVGALTAANLYRRGTISKSELCRLLTFVSNPGAAFVIYAVGGSMLGSVTLGVVLYLSVILSAVIAGIASRLFMNTDDALSPTVSDPPLPLSRVIVPSVTNAVTGSLNVCAYAAFFSAVVGVLSVFLTRLGASFQLRAALFGFFELVGGVGILTRSGSGLFAILSTAAVCSWSGVSVLMQTVAVCRSAMGDGELSFLPMIISKLIQSALSPTLLFLMLKLTRFDI